LVVTVNRIGSHDYQVKQMEWTCQIDAGLPLFFGHKKKDVSIWTHPFVYI